MTATEALRIAPITRVTVMPVRLDPLLWPPCPDCKLDVNHCECDPHTGDHREEE